MKHLVLIFIFTTIANAQGQPDPAQTAGLGCLEEQWAQINPSDEDKKFDIENDFDGFGNRISCKNYITPTELNIFLLSLKNAVKNKNKEDVAELIKFPLRTSLDGMAEVPKGARAMGNGKIIRDKKQFIAQYDEIMLPTSIKIIQCMQLNTIFSHAAYGTGSHSGEIWLNHAYGTRDTKVVSFSSSPETDKHWLEKECSW